MNGHLALKISTLVVKNLSNSSLLLSIFASIVNILNHSLLRSDSTWGPIKIWLGYQDSNLGMLESKSSALPLGDTPLFIPYKKLSFIHCGVDAHLNFAQQTHLG